MGKSNVSEGMQYWVKPCQEGMPLTNEQHSDQIAHHRCRDGMVDGMVQIR
jgi:hypothetical protein